jgi:uracil-DNA glycosylase family 4
MDGRGGRSEKGRATARQVARRLESLAAAGVTDLPKRGRKRAATATSPAASVLGKDDRLRILREEVAACHRCPALARARANTVFGSGPATARLCFLGEAPGADEDASGEPFVGRAGQLLTKIIEACTLSRGDVYILNVLKCRPPENRAPLPEETANCRGYFERQLEIIAPEFICCLGTTAAQALLETEETIGKLRGRWFSWRSAQVLCTYHPSYLLRNPPAKRQVWDDMKLLMGKMGVDL